jgi:ribose transport system substrate-binding protein
MTRGGTFLLAIAAAVALTAGAAFAATTAKPAKVSIAFVGADLPDPFYITMHCGASAAAKQFDVDFTWQGTNGVDFHPELTVLNAIAQRKPQGIILAPFDPTAFIQPVKKLMDGGTPVVTVDGNLSRKVELQNIRTDNFGAGKVAGLALGKILHGKGAAAVVSFSPTVPVQRDRVNGFKAALQQKYPGVKVVSVQYGGADAGKSAQVTAALLRAHPELNGLYATDTNDAEGASSAIRAAGKSGKVKLIAYDASPKEVAGLKSGLFDGLVAQAPYDEGFQAVKTLAQVIRGQVKKGSVPYQFGTGAAFISRANVGSPAIKKYLYRGTC